MMRMGWVIALWFLAGPALAEVVAQAPQGFKVRHDVVVTATPAELYAALGKVDRWWSQDHTYSGSTANLSLDLKAGGCFCEIWDKGAVEHLRVAAARPGQVLVLKGGLGPLQSMADGAMTFALKAEGSGTRLTFTYVVWGFGAPGFDAMAPVVDKMLGEQVARLKNFVEAR